MKAARLCGTGVFWYGSPDTEYKSYATCAQVLAYFRPERPIVNIVEAEARHFSALLAAVQGEIDDVVIYDRVMNSTTRPDILRVYRALRAASLERHLPSFRRCAERGERRCAR